MSRLANMITWLVFAYPCTLSASAATTVTTQKGATVDLHKITTEAIAFQMGSATIQIPLPKIAKIELASDGNTLTLQTASGKELKGKSSSCIEGEWESGKYSVSLRDIRLVDFGRLPAHRKVESRTDQPDGFAVSCTDHTGVEMQVYRFRYGFGYSILGRGDAKGTEHEQSRDFLPFRCNGALVAIPFADLNTVEAVEDATEYGEPRVKIRMIDDGTLSGRIAELGEWRQAFIGETEFGSFRLPIQKLRRITFDHSKDKNAKRATFDKVRYHMNQVTPYTVSIVTWGGDKCQLRNACTFELDLGFVWKDAATTFEFKYDEASITVDYDKVRRIKVNERGKPKASWTTASGKILPVEMLHWSSDGRQTCLGGELERFGTGWIEIRDVASIDVSRTPKR